MAEQSFEETVSEIVAAYSKTYILLCHDDRRVKLIQSSPTEVLQAAYPEIERQILERPGSPARQIHRAAEILLPEEQRALALQAVYPAVIDRTLENVKVGITDTSPIATSGSEERILPSISGPQAAAMVISAVSLLPEEQRASVYDSIVEELSRQKGEEESAGKDSGPTAFLIDWLEKDRPEFTKDPNLRGDENQMGGAHLTFG